MARTKKSCPSEKYKAKRRECKKLSMRKAREKLKDNPELLEEVRRKDRERKRQQRKKINDMNDRDQRDQRKKWRQCSKTYRANIKKKKLLEEELNVNTPPNSPDLNINPLPSTSRLDSGKKIRRTERRKLRKKMQKLQDEKKELLRKVEKYRKRAYRLEKSIATTPLKKTKEILVGRKCSKEIKKRLLFGEVLKNQLQKHFLKENELKRKRNLAKFISGKVVKKYKMLSQMTKIASRRMIVYTKPLSGNEVKKRIKIRRDIEFFLKLDENSRQCPGKRDTVTKSKRKMQKRILLDTLVNLHKKFTCSSEYKELSYSEFCKLRPFWIISPNYRDRDTCVCKTHDNMFLIIQRLHSLQLIREKNSEEILQAVTCDKKLGEKCLERACPLCCKLKIDFLTYDKDDSVKYYQWVDKKVEIEFKGKKRTVKKVIKEEIESTKNGLVQAFERQFLKFAGHVSNIKHQYKAIKFIKENLRIDEIVLHMDFSENYNCKYSKEVQSMHFGGSRNQVSLHTSVLYYNKEGIVESVPFCTISEDTRHNNVAICAHLVPVLNEIKNIVPHLSKIHFVSDGPSNQYRNRKMFVLATTFLAKLACVKTIHWHFLEAGHGKGAPDGIGGCLKRTADGIVARGIDIPNCEVLAQQLRLNCSGITLFPVTSAEIDKCNNITVPLPSFNGILKVHEISWSKDDENIIQVRRLTCTICLPNQICPHYDIGQIHIFDCSDTESDEDLMPTNKSKIRLSYGEVYSDVDDSDSSCSMDTVSHEEFLKQPKINDYIIVKFAGKKTFHYYIGLVIQCQRTEIEVKFMKKSSGKKFIFPEMDDVSVVDLKDIICVLNQPSVNNRQQYEFVISEKYIKLL